ncbi:MAG: hypothetical protein HON23_03330 [Rickettsiales bacterium]|jgi:hypothetical protein|nr:hypothetical protein [Rickettsiales bacterium]
MDLYQEMTMALEKGFFKQLDSSIKYAPLKFFVHLYINANPEVIDNVRNYVRNDIENALKEQDLYQEEYFITKSAPTEQGKAALKQCFNLGIYVMSRKLTVRSGFKLVTNADFRYQIYIFTLGSVERIIDKIINAG